MLHEGRLRAVLRGEGEHARPLDLHFPQKIAQLLKGRIVLIGQAGNQAGAKHQSGNLLPQLFQQGQQVCLGVPAVHGL